VELLMTDRPRSQLPGIDADEPQKMEKGGEGEGSERTVRPGPPATPGEPEGEHQHDGGDQQG
jgi:hypothetical protein